LEEHPLRGRQTADPAAKVFSWTKPGKKKKKKKKMGGEGGKRKVGTRPPSSVGKLKGSDLLVNSSVLQVQKKKKEKIPHRTAKRLWGEWP